MYDPKPAHMFYPSLAFAVGTACALNDLNTMAIAMYIIGAILIAWIALAGAMSPIIELIREKRMQMDSAKNLDLDRMAALGLTSNPVNQTSETRITYEDRHGSLERQDIIRTPISDVRLQVLAKNILEGVSFSRRALAKDRSLLSESEFDKVAKVWRDNGIIYYKDPAHENLGYEFSNAGKAYLRDKAGVPSPTPRMEVSENIA